MHGSQMTHSQDPLENKKFDTVNNVVAKHSPNLDVSLREIVLKKHRKHPILKRICLQEDRDWHLTFGMLQDVLERPFNCVYRPSQ